MKLIEKQYIEPLHLLCNNWTISIVSLWRVSVDKAAEPGKSNSRPIAYISGLTIRIQIAVVQDFVQV